jgi:hypothetical protein
MDNGVGPYHWSHRGEAEAMLLILLRRTYYSWLIFASSSRQYTEMIFEGNMINTKSHDNDGLIGKCDKLGGHPAICCCMLQTYNQIVKRSKNIGVD